MCGTNSKKRNGMGNKDTRAMEVDTGGKMNPSDEKAERTIGIKVDITMMDTMTTRTTRLLTV